MSPKKTTRASKAATPKDEAENMPDLREDIRGSVVAIVCSDLHFSHVPPLARSAEPDWYAVMGRYISILRKLARSLDVPVICAGDIFDTWNNPPELVNFLIDHLPHMYAVPGQHDLCHHNYDNWEKTSYGTLVKAGMITNLSATPREVRGTMLLYGFPWGHPLLPCEEKSEQVLKIAVCHKYVWIDGKGHEKAEEADRLRLLKSDLVGYNSVIFGDNHKGFTSTYGLQSATQHVMNCGTFLRRKSDERHYKPMIGLLLVDGTIAAYYLPTTADKWLDEVPDLGTVLGPVEAAALGDFLAKMQDTDKASIDFRDEVRRYLNSTGVGRMVKQIILEVLEAC